MEKRKYWMWARRKLTDKPLVGTLYHKISSTYNDLREEQDFVEDAASNLGDYIWPPRSYSCSFCRREFRSAQALGGHMNVHRRDRARLKQSPSPTGEGQEKQLPDQVGSLVCRTLSSPNCIAVASMHEHSDNNSDRFLTDPRTAQRVAMMDMNLGKEKLKLREVGYSIPSCRSDHDDDVDLISGKRRHMDPMFPFFMKSSSDQHHHHHQHHHHQQQQQQPEVLKLGARPVEELDLELRLGSDPKF